MFVGNSVQHLSLKVINLMKLVKFIKKCNSLLFCYYDHYVKD